MSEDRIGTDEESRAEQMKVGPKVAERTGRGREERRKGDGAIPRLIYALATAGIVRYPSEK